MTDNLTVMQASVTKTATFASTALTLPTRTPRRGLFVRVLYSAATNASGSNSVQFDVQASPDSGSTWYLHTSGAEQIINLSTTAQSGEIFLPIETTDGQIRLNQTTGGAGSTPTITYQGDLCLGFPS